MDPTILIEKLSEMRSLFEYKPFFDWLSASGALSMICRMSVLLTAMASLFHIGHLVLRYQKDAMNRGFFPMLIQIALIVFLFGNPLTYKAALSPILGGIKALEDKIFGSVMLQFQSEFRFAIAMVAERSKDGVNLMNPSLDTATVDVLIFSLAFNFILILFWLIISYSPLLVIFAVALGPLIAPFSLIPISRGILGKWAMFLLASAFFSIFASILLMALLEIGSVRTLADLGLNGTLFPAVLFSVLGCLILLNGPFLFAEIFGVPAIDIPGRIISVLALCLGLIPLFVGTLSGKKRNNDSRESRDSSPSAPAPSDSGSSAPSAGVASTSSALPTPS